MAKNGSAKYWWGVLYPENMVEGWENIIGDILQLPYCYAKHTLDKDSKSEHRKDHVHLIIVFNNTTTYNFAFSIFDKLSAEGRKALNKIEAVQSIRYVYDYLIHDTETCKKLGKELYLPTDRIMGNNFDIGCYEQISMQEEDEMRKELIDEIVKNGFTDMIDLYKLVVSNYDIKYLKLILHNGHCFDIYTKANYLKWKKAIESQKVKEDSSYKA